MRKLGTASEPFKDEARATNFGGSNGFEGLDRSIPERQRQMLGFLENM